MLPITPHSKQHLNVNGRNGAKQRKLRKKSHKHSPQTTQHQKRRIVISKYNKGALNVCRKRYYARTGSGGRNISRLTGNMIQSDTTYKTATNVEQTTSKGTHHHFKYAFLYFLALSRSKQPYPQHTAPLINVPSNCSSTTNNIPFKPETAVLCKPRIQMANDNWWISRWPRNNLSPDNGKKKWQNRILIHRTPHQRFPRRSASE